MIKINCTGTDPYSASSEPAKDEYIPRFIVPLDSPPNLPPGLPPVATAAPPPYSPEESKLVLDAENDARRKLAGRFEASGLHDPYSGDWIDRWDLEWTPIVSKVSGIFERQLDGRQLPPPTVADFVAFLGNAEKVSPFRDLEPFDQVDLPPFPTDMLPDILREWVEAESHATQTPPDMAALLALTVCAAALAKRVTISPKHGWSEPVNLFTATLMESGNRKSAVFRDAVAPLRAAENDLLENTRSRIKQQRQEYRTTQKRMEKLENQAAKTGEPDDMRAAIELSEQLGKMPYPAYPQLITDNCTAEKLEMLLAEQGGRMASLSPEGSVFDIMAGLYANNGGTSSFDVYLKGHAGDDIRTDRVTRRAVNIEAPALTAGFTMQPAVVEGLAEKKIAFRGRGLLARFLYAAPRSWVGEREIDPTPIPPQVSDNYHRLVYSLEINPPQGELRLTQDALRAFSEWRAEIEPERGEFGKWGHIADWASKLDGAAMRIASVLHCAGGRDAETYVDTDTVKAAIAICNYLVPHADHVLSMMEAKQGPDNNDAAYVWRWIERSKQREFTKRDVQRAAGKRFAKADDIDAPLKELVDRGYIRPLSMETEGPGRKPSPRYEVNPKALERHSVNSVGRPAGEWE